MVEVAAQELAELLKVAALVRVGIELALLFLLLLGLPTQSQWAQEALVTLTARIQFFLLLHQQVVARVVAMEQPLEAQAGLVVALAGQQLRGLVETRLAHHHHREITAVLV